MAKGLKLVKKTNMNYEVGISSDEFHETDESDKILMKKIILNCFWPLKYKKHFNYVLVLEIKISFSLKKKMCL